MITWNHPRGKREREKNKKKKPTSLKSCAKNIEAFKQTSTMKQRCWLVSLSHSEEDVSRAEGELGKKTRRKTIGISQVVQNK